MEPITGHSKLLTTSILQPRETLTNLLTTTTVDLPCHVVLRGDRNLTIYRIFARN